MASRADRELHQRTFQGTLNAAMDELLEYGYDSQERVDKWLAALRRTAREAMVPEVVLERNVREILHRTYVRTTKREVLIKRHPGVNAFTLERVKPRLRAELDRRIVASANLIKLDRQASIERTLQRFQGWSTSIPAGGAPQASARDEARLVRKGIAGLPFTERRVVIDQAHKLTRAIDDVIAEDGGAIFCRWMHVREVGYNARPHHVARDGHVYIVRDNWAMQRGLVKLGGHEYSDAVVDKKGNPDGPSQGVYCRCRWVYGYTLDSLKREAPECLTKAGLEMIEKADRIMGASFMNSPTLRFGAPSRV